MSKITIRTGVAIAAFVAAAGAAQAADLARPYRAAPEISAPIYANWTGGYVGVNFGYGFATSDWTVPGATTSTNPKGALAGATVGYNFQTGVWVWGLEGDWDWSGMKGDGNCGGVTCTTKNSWLGTARGRLGYAGWSNWLPYLTGGVAGGNLKAQSVLGETSSTRIGWTAGLGAEYAMLSNWSLKAEYLYMDLGSFDCAVACGGPGVDVNFKANIIRGGLNYRF